MGKAIWSLPYFDIKQTMEKWQKYRNLWSRRKQKASIKILWIQRQTTPRTTNPDWWSAAGHHSIRNRRAFRLRLFRDNCGSFPSSSDTEPLLHSCCWRSIGNYLCWTGQEIRCLGHSTQKGRSRHRYLCSHHAPKAQGVPYRCVRGI